MQNFRSSDELRRRHRRSFELALIFTLLLHIGLFHAAQHIAVMPKPFEVKETKITVEDIPKTEQTEVRLPTHISSPEVPVPVENEWVPENLSIESTTFELSDIPAPPPISEDEVLSPQFEYTPYEEPPEPIGGYAQMGESIQYPVAALDSQTEGLVIIGVCVNSKGHTTKMQILRRSLHDVGFEQAAIDALGQAKWIPAKQRGKPVGVWIAIPVRFRLQSATFTVMR